MSHRARGFSFPELLLVLVLISILAAAAVPRMNALVDQIRANGALDRVVAEVYRARMTAVQGGRPAALLLLSDGAGCIDRVRIAQPTAADWATATTPLESGALCVRHTGDSVLTFNGRGMLRPPARSIYIRSDARADSVLISIAGRVRRSD